MVDMIFSIVLTLTCMALVVLVLLQQGKGADAGAAFGGGASQTVFGSSGSGDFLSRLTWGLGFVFFFCALGIAHLAQVRQEMPVESQSISLDSASGDVPAAPSASEGMASDVPEAGAVEESSSDVPVAPAAPAGEEGVEATPEDVPAANDEAADESAQESTEAESADSKPAE